eukprot:6481390-Pyramimonas_sp.AAC.1
MAGREHCTRAVRQVQQIDSGTQIEFKSVCYYLAGPPLLLEHAEDRPLLQRHLGPPHGDMSATARHTATWRRHAATHQRPGGPGGPGGPKVKSPRATCALEER